MKLALLALALFVLSCSAAVPPHQVVNATAEPDDVALYVWEAELEGVGSEGQPTETQLGELLAQARVRWPQHWEFQAQTASHYVRTGDMTNAAAFHAKARALYVSNPVMQTGTRGAALTATLLGGIVGGVVYAALADEVPLEFPAAPSAETWSPPLGADYARGR